MVKKLLKRAAAFAAAVLACGALAVGGKGYVLYREALEGASLEKKVEQIRQKEDYTPLEELPPVYLQAVLSVEDHRFYRHPGVDVIAVARAAINDLRAMAFVEGGSTITQQLAKNMYFTQEKKLTRKAAELFMALKMERELTKDEILELYVNSIYFGNGYYSVKQASRGYFGKEPGDMSEYESTLLAGIPNAPSVYALTENPGLAAKRQEQVVERLVECGYYTQVQAQETLAAGEA